MISYADVGDAMTHFSMINHKDGSAVREAFSQFGNERELFLRHDNVCGDCGQHIG
jgi:hypothetical protein